MSWSGVFNCLIYNEIFMLNMKVKRFYFVLALSVLVLSSCAQRKELVYINDATRDSICALKGEYMSGIQVNDMLSIYVESETPESTIQFNQETNKIIMSPTGQSMGNIGGQNQHNYGYLVDYKGEISFPVFGKIQVVGMTLNQLERYIERQLITKGYISDPKVTVKLLNFRAFVLGDVRSPGEVTTTGERLTIFEALSMAGDLNITALRNNVTVIREENGTRIIGAINLASKDVFDSPYYYLRQNDVVYVEPNARQKKSADRDTYALSVTSMVLSSATTLLSLTMTLITLMNTINK